MNHHGTDWNRHHGVGATLLENWVEERAVGDVIVQERSDISKLSRYGHKDILTHHGDKDEPIQSTHREAFTTLSRTDLTKTSLGKRRQLMEAELLKMAMSETVQLPTTNTAKEWLSTTKDDFSHTDLYPPLDKLGSHLPDPKKSEHFARPITFWTDSAAKGSGTAICSTSASLLHGRGHGVGGFTETLDDAIGHKAGQVHQHQASAVAIRFGKHSAFSTPIQEYKKGPVKK